MVPCSPQQDKETAATEDDFQEESIMADLGYERPPPPKNKVAGNPNIQELAPTGTLLLKIYQKKPQVQRSRASPA